MSEVRSGMKTRSKTKKGTDAVDKEQPVDQEVKDQNSVSLVSRRSAVKQLERERKLLEETYKLELEERKVAEEAEQERLRREFKLRQIQLSKNLLAAKRDASYYSENESEEEDQEARDIFGVRGETLEEKVERLSLSSAEKVTDTRKTTCDSAPESEMLKQIIRMQPVSLIDFEGGTDDFFAFRSAFVRLEKKGVFDDNDLLSMLLAHVKGEAKRALTGILHGSGQYDRAWEILTSRYGNKTRITINKLEVIRKHPQVNANDLVQLRSFIDAISAFIEALRCSGKENEMHSSLLIGDLLPKLPRNVVHAWNKMVARQQVHETLLDFKEYLVTEEKVWEADPTSSKTSEKGYRGCDKKFRHDDRGARSEKYAGITVANQSGYCVLHASKGHSTNECRSFTKNSVPERLKIAKRYGLCFLCLTKGHRTTDCKSTSRCSSCGRTHHILLHAGDTISNTDYASTAAEDRSLTQTIPQTTEVASFSALFHQSALLGVVPVEIIGPKKRVVINAFLDYGSNITMLNLQVAKQVGLVNEDAMTKKLKVTGVHGDGWCEAVSIKDMQLRAISSAERQVLNVAQVTAVNGFKGPSQITPWEKVASSFPMIEKYGIARTSAEHALLVIGTDNFGLMLYDQYITASHKDGPVMVRTPLGYVVFGKLPSESAVVTSFRCQAMPDTDELSKQLNDYFIVENSGIRNESLPLLAREDQRAMEVIAKGTRRLDAERAYVSAMPWKDVNPCLPNNKEQAKNRLFTLEKKLLKSPDLYAKYDLAIKEDVKKGYIIEVAEEESNAPSPVTWYLPHWHIVHKKKPDKFRRVYDCSAIFKGQSLNKLLYKGPNLLADLVDVLLRFREYGIAVAADICEMYNQIRVPVEDQPCLQFLWRSDPRLPVKTFRFQRMLFGDVSAPCRAVYVLQQVANEFEETFPRGAKAVKCNMYLDDLMVSCETAKDAIELKAEIMAMMKESGFQMKKWVSNSHEVMSSIEKGDRAAVFSPALKSATNNRVLGLAWRMEEDTFTYSSLEEQVPRSKRHIVSLLASLWDPLGFLAPYLIRAKLMVQQLWSLQLDWDATVPQHLLKEWTRWYCEMKDLPLIAVPRALTTRADQPIESSLQVFADASQKAFATVAYMRTVYAYGHTECRLIMAKTKVAPLKPQLTIPRLELNAALLAARLANKLTSIFTRKIHCVDFWLDSSIVLCWINRSTKVNKEQYVTNRLSEIEMLAQQIASRVGIVNWHHVASEDNPSDECTRGIELKMLLDSRFIEGPAFLLQPRSGWPQKQFDISHAGDDNPPAVWLAVKDESQEFDLRRYSNLLKAQRVLAYTLRFSINCRASAELKRRGSLQAVEYKEAMKKLLELSQAELHETVRKWGKNKRLINLNPVMMDGLLCVGGRLGNATCLTEASRHPVIVDGNKRIALLIVRDYHCKYGHPGPQFLMNLLRERYWIIRLSWLVKKVRRNCVLCNKRCPKTYQPKMADLPQVRVEPTLPFTKCGVDYFGPFLVKRGRSLEKCWGVIFTCFATRAIHIELADSLSTECFINVLRRFIGRRGEPHEIWSDNGTNFVGADRALRQEIQKLKNSAVEKELAAREIIWHFNPPSASHFGGAWERLIRSIRKALFAVMNGRSMTYSVLETAMIEVEALMNSRPLTRVSSDPDDQSALTPGHFLILRPYTAKVPGLVNDREVNSRNAWRKAQSLVNMFWRRWLKEYVPSLTERSKWQDGSGREARVGDLVLVVENNTARGQWPLAIVEKVYPGNDGVVRVVDVRMNGTVIRRPVTKLSYVLAADEPMGFD